jgi:hypothetical protein
MRKRRPLTRLVADKVWKRLRRAARKAKGKGAVAVAYLGQGGARLLPLQRGSVLVVDASDASVRAGQTCPTDLQTLRARGVRVFSATNLHAKVFVFGTRAFVGSANASSHSARTLVEAVLETGDREVVADARAFVRSLALHELGPAALKRLQTIYKAPRLYHGPARRPRGVAIGLPDLRIAQLRFADPPAGSERTQRLGRARAQKLLSKPRHAVDHFWWPSPSPFRPGMIVIQVLHEDRKRQMVTKPGTVINVRRWQKRGRRASFVYLEIPIGRRVPLERLKQRIGSPALLRLKRGGKVNAELAQELLGAWQS